MKGRGDEHVAVSSSSLLSPSLVFLRVSESFGLPTILPRLILLPLLHPSRCVLLFVSVALQLRVESSVAMAGALSARGPPLRMTGGGGGGVWKAVSGANLSLLPFLPLNQFSSSALVSSRPIPCNSLNG